MSISETEIDKMAKFVADGLRESYEKTDNDLVKHFLVRASSPVSNFYVSIESDEDGNYIAFTIGVFQKWIFDKVGYGILMEMFVAEGHRDGQLALKMLEEFESWGKDKGAYKITTLTEASYEKPLSARGYNKSLSMFEKEVTHTTQPET